MSDAQTLEELQKFLSHGENTTIEVKLSIDGPKDKVAKAICGLANQKGGRIFIGLAEKKFYKPEMGSYTNDDVIFNEFIVYGVKNPDRARLELASHLRQNTNIGTNLQLLYEDIKQLVLNEKTILVIKVKPYFNMNKSPVLYKNLLYRRIDNQTVELTVREAIAFLSGDPTASLHIQPVNNMDSNDSEDNILHDAIRIVTEAGKASTSLLQRRLRIGYGRASRIIDVLFEIGIIGESDGARPRQTLVFSYQEAIDKLNKKSE